MITEKSNVKVTFHLGESKMKQRMISPEMKSQILSKDGWRHTSFFKNEKKAEEKWKKTSFYDRLRCYAEDEAHDIHAKSVFLEEC